MRIGELSERTGVSVPAIRYYEALGLLHRPSRSHVGHRFYGSTVLERLHVIQQAKALTLRLREIRELLRLSDRGECPCERAKQLLLQHLADLQRTIRHEQGLVRQIEQVAASLLPHDRAVQPEGICLYLMPVPKRARRPRPRAPMASRCKATHGGPLGFARAGGGAGCRPTRGVRLGATPTTPRSGRGRGGAPPSRRGRA